MQLNSNRQYLLNAFRDWLNDQDKTPYIIIDCDFEGVSVPPEVIRPDGRVCLDIASNMVRNFKITPSLLTFEAQISGKVCTVHLPLGSIISIMCKETGWTAWFDLFDGNKEVKAPVLPPRFKLEEDL